MRESDRQSDRSHAHSRRNFLMVTASTAVVPALGRAAKPDSMRVLGPAPAPIERIKRRYRWQVVVKAQELNEMRAALSTMRAETAVMAEDSNVHVIIDVDPINML